MSDDLRRQVELARQRDEAAFEALYERFERSTYSLCWHLLGSDDAAADAVQETFVKVYEHLPRLRAPEAFASWLRATALNVCRHQRRKGRLLRLEGELTVDEDEPVEHPDPAPQPAEAVETGELTREVRRALLRLSVPHREVVVLHHLEGLPLDQIAGTLGVAIGTVKSRLGRARQHLERLLTPYVGDEE